MSNTKDFKVKNGIQPTVYHEAVGTVVSGSVPYAAEAATYENKSYSFSALGGGARGFNISGDGTKAYYCEIDNSKIFQVDLSTAWDISTATYNSDFLSVSNSVDIDFNQVGSVSFVLEGTTIREYTLSTSWDISTASSTGNTLSVSSQTSAPRGFTFSGDGTKLFLSGGSVSFVFEYSLSTAYDITSASYTGRSYDTSGQEANPWDVLFSPSGLSMYVSGVNSNAIHHYALANAFDLTQVSFLSSRLLENSDYRGLSFGDSGSKLYALQFKTAEQYSTVLTTAELDLSTGSVFDYTPTSDVQVTLTNPAASGTSSGATLLLDGGVGGSYDLANAAYDSVSLSITSQTGSNAFAVDVSSDGTKVYAFAQSGTVFQYTLSTAWDLSTATYSGNSFEAFTGGTGTPNSVRFGSNGTKMYIISVTPDTIYQYTLSTAWDVSTASYDSITFAATSQDTSPTSFYFKSDGTKLYILGNANDTVYQYSVGTAWDVSSASYDSVSRSLFTGALNSITFNADGTKFFIMNNTDDTLHEYVLTTAWDLSTASSTGVTYNTTTQDSASRDVAFKSDGAKMYLVGSTGDSIYQYSTATPATITYDTAIEWPSGTAPTSPAIGETDVITFNTRDGGSTYQAVQAINGAK